MIVSQITELTWISSWLLPKLPSRRETSEEGVGRPFLKNRNVESVLFSLVYDSSTCSSSSFTFVPVCVVCLYPRGYVNIFTDSCGKNRVLQMCMSTYARIALYWITSAFHFQPCIIYKQTHSSYLVAWQILVAIIKHKCNYHIVLAMNF